MFVYACSQWKFVLLMTQHWNFVVSSSTTLNSLRDKRIASSLKFLMHWSSTRYGRHFSFLAVFVLRGMVFFWFFLKHFSVRYASPLFSLARSLFSWAVRLGYVLLVDFSRPRPFQWLQFMVAWNRKIGSFWRHTFNSCCLPLFAQHLIGAWPFHAVLRAIIPSSLSSHVSLSPRMFLVVVWILKRSTLLSITICLRTPIPTCIV